MMHRLKPLTLIFLCSLTGVAMAAPTLADKEIFGVHEKVHLKELGITLPAKLDTGAESASLSAKYIDIFEKDGKKYVEFDIALNDDDKDELGIDKDKLDDIVLPLDDHVRIKRRSENTGKNDKSYSTRPVVKIEVCLGDKVAKIDVNLTDRSMFKYPLLLGSRSLTHLKAVIDPSQSMTAGAPKCTNKTD